MPNIKLKDGSGIEQTYNNVNTITVPLADGTGTYTFGLSNQELTFSGNCNYLFASPAACNIFQKYQDRITTQNVTGIMSMFNGWTGDVNFDINYVNNTSGSFSISQFPLNGPTGRLTGFTGSLNVSAPNGQISDMQGFFNSCNYVRTLPTITGLKEVLQRASSSNNCQFANCFSGCYSLRSIPSDLLKEMYSRGTSSGWNYHIYYSFGYLYALNKVEGLPVYRGSITSNVMNSFGQQCNRISEFKFDTNNGTPYSVNWSDQVLNLSNYTGWVQSDQPILDYNSGITTAKKVTDAASYAALKNDPDWYTTDVNYSRYNHDSAVNTINSLPDCSSSGGTNTIKFKGTAGTYTDCGAISNLTSSEIAVATAKGWTVQII